MFTWIFAFLIMVVVLALNIIHIEEHGMGVYLKLLKTPIPWCTLVGMVVGYVGIPVLNPDSMNQWVWHPPYGFRGASILFLGTLGCLIGLFFTYLFRKDSARAATLWVTGSLSFALLVATIGVYRDQAEHESAMWTQINIGFVLSSQVSRMNLTTTTLQKDRKIGTQIIVAGSDLKAANNFGEFRYPKLGYVASAFSEAGYYLVTQTNKEKLQESIQFMNQASSLIHEIGNQSYPNKTKNFQQLLTEISDKIPKDFSENWG